MNNKIIGIMLMSPLILIFISAVLIGSFLIIRELPLVVFIVVIIGIIVVAFIKGADMYSKN